MASLGSVRYVTPLSLSDYAGCDIVYILLNMNPDATEHPDICIHLDRGCPHSLVAHCILQCRC